jgi:Protein of unknown function (DUF1203)
MSTYRFQGIPDSIAAAARESMKSPQYGHPAHTEVAAGYGPCRQCLQTFRVAPRLALESYGAAGVLLAQRRVGTVPFESALQEVFEPAEVRYAHLRNAEAGCFIGRIDRQ